jgi:hypothetical protein
LFRPAALAEPCPGSFTLSSSWKGYVAPKVMKKPADIVNDLSTFKYVLFSFVLLRFNFLLVFVFFLLIVFVV